MDSDDSAVLAYRWIVSGRVQGVGFRWFVLRAARQAGATGWVSNRSDGRVEVMGQGTVSTLHDLEKALEQGPMMSFVENVEKTEVTSEMGTFKSFEIN